MFLFLLFNNYRFMTKQIILSPLFSLFVVIFRVKQQPKPNQIARNFIWQQVPMAAKIISESFSVQNQIQNCVHLDVYLISLPRSSNLIRRTANSAGQQIFFAGLNILGHIFCFIFSAGGSLLKYQHSPIKLRLSPARQKKQLTPCLTLFVQNTFMSKHFSYNNRMNQQALRKTQSKCIPIPVRDMLFLWPLKAVTPFNTRLMLFKPLPALVCGDTAVTRYEKMLFIDLINVTEVFKRDTVGCSQV